MKLYIVLTNYHILAACALAIANGQKNNDMLVEGNVDVEPDVIKRLRDTGWFRNIYYINQSKAWNNLNKLDMYSSRDEIIKYTEEVVSFWNNEFVNFRKITKEYEDVCIWDDHFTLGLALAYKKVPYNYYEESPGCNCRREVFIDLSKRGISNKAFAPIVEYFGTRGAYPYAKSYNYDFELNEMDKGPRDFNFSIFSAIKDATKVEKNFMNDMYMLFGNDTNIFDFGKNFDDNKGNFLLIAQHYSDKIYKNTTMIRYELSLLADYFGEDKNIWIKNHPSNYFNPIKEWFAGESFINDKIPIEIVISDDERVKFDTVASAVSSAAQSLENKIKNVVLFQNVEDTDSFMSERRFLDFHRYFVAIMLTQKLNNNFRNITGIGTENNMIKYLFEYYTNLNVDDMEFLPDEVFETSSMLENNSNIYIVDRVLSKDELVKKNVLKWLSDLDTKTVVFFINSDSSNAFFSMEDVQIQQNVYPIPILVEAMNDTCDLFGFGQPEYPLNTLNEAMQINNKFINYERQIIYMYTKNDETAQCLLSCSIEKKLRHCGLKITSNPLEMNYEEIVLRGTLEQLEQAYNELRVKYDDLKKVDYIRDDLTEEEINDYIKKLVNLLAERKQQYKE